MEGKLYKSPNGEHYYLTVDGKIFAEIGGHPLKSINQSLSLKNCQSIENGYDLDEMADEYIIVKPKYREYEHNLSVSAYKAGFNKAIEILGDKKFSESNLRIGYNLLLNLEKEKDELSEVFIDRQYRYIDSIIKSLQQTEWDVEIEMENSLCNGYKNQPDNIFGFIAEYKSVPKLDEDGCLILKRK